MQPTVPATTAVTGAADMYRWLHHNAPSKAPHPNWSPACRLTVPRLPLPANSILVLQPVPDARLAARELPQGTTSDTAGRYYGQAVLTSSHSYGYGSSGRHLLLQGGTYGTYALSTASGGYGYGSSRGLIEEDSNTLLEPFDPLLEYAEQHRPAASRLGTVAAAALQQPQAQHGSSANASSQQVVGIPAGKCYCRYDSDFNTWALAEDSCRQALYTRCQVGGQTCHPHCSELLHTCTKCFTWYALGRPIWCSTDVSA